MSEEALPGTTRAKTHSEEFRGTMDQIRSRTNTTAKGLAAIGTAAIGGLGYVKLADVYPYDGPAGSKIALFLGVAAMIAAVILLVRNFFAASQTVITKPSIDQTIEANEITKGQEIKLIHRAYDEAAEASGVHALRELEARAKTVEKEALEAAKAQRAEDAKRLHQEAERDFAEVQAAQDRAATFILRRRSTSALFGLWPLFLLVLFVAGWYSTALAADAMQSEREDEVNVVKNCGEAHSAAKDVVVKSPNICEDWGFGPPTDAIAGEAAAAVAAIRRTCLEAAERGRGEKANCSSLVLAASKQGKKPAKGKPAKGSGAENNGKRGNAGRRQASRR